MALLEFPRGLTPQELAGGFGLPGAGSFAGGAEESFRRRLAALPDPARLLLVIAAAETSGDPALMWRAAALLGIGPDAATPATEADLAEFGAPVRFRHPLVRSLAYRSASADERRSVHGALAEVTDPQADPDRRAWHRAEASPGPDEDVAVDLERSADRAQARGGAAPSVSGGETVGAHRCEPRPRHLSRRILGRLVRRPTGSRRRFLGGGAPCRRGAALAIRPASARPVPRRLGRALQRRIYREPARSAQRFGGLWSRHVARMWHASNAALHVWDDARWIEMSTRHVQLARDRGALSELPPALSSRTFTMTLAGELPAAAALIDEVRTVTDATGSSLASNGALGVAAFRGRAAEVALLSESTLRDSTRHGEGYGITTVEWANAVLNNGLGRYEEAMAAAQRCRAYPGDFTNLPVWSSVELVEAAIRSGRRDVANEAHHTMYEMASASGTDWALGLAARSRALLGAGDTAEALYREAIDRLGRTRVRVELARSHLVYGEWLRRERRRTDAREQLRTAHDMFEAMGMEAFADRAGRELQVTGETARKRTEVERAGRLTAQELQVARLARDGLSNPEIGGRLFLSARTVQYHLRHVFTKLGISSRSQLAEVISDSGSA